MNRWTVKYVMVFEVTVDVFLPLSLDIDPDWRGCRWGGVVYKTHREVRYSNCMCSVFSRSATICDSEQSLSHIGHPHRTFWGTDSRRGEWLALCKYFGKASSDGKVASRVDVMEAGTDQVTWSTHRFYVCYRLLMIVSQQQLTRFSWITGL